MYLCGLQVAALELASEADPVAEAIGAANTLVRQPGGGLKAYNTDWSAAISAVEAAMTGPYPAVAELCSALLDMLQADSRTLQLNHLRLQP